MTHEINIWLDDDRKAPQGYEHVTSAKTVLVILSDKNYSVINMSLDYNLYVDEPNGVDLLVEMVKRGLWSKNKPEVHTSCGAIGEFMVYIIENYFEKKVKDVTEDKLRLEYFQKGFRIK